MGRDKSLLSFGGTTMGRRTADLLLRVSTLAIEVGTGTSGLRTTSETPAGEGPLAAIAAGRRALGQKGHRGSALVVACDLPFLNEGLLRFLVNFDTPNSLIPVVNGYAQPLCAKWGPRDLDDVDEHIARGERSLRFLEHQPGNALIDESVWGDVATTFTFADVDSPTDLVHFGLTPDT